jgi:hypothetical protein
MDEDQLFLRPAKPPPAGISETEYRIADELDCLKAQRNQLRRERFKIATFLWIGRSLRGLTHRRRSDD